MIKRLKYLVSSLSIVLLLSGCGSFESAVLQDRNGLIYKSSSSSLEVLKKSNFPLNQSAAAFITNEDLKAAISVYEGTSIEFLEDGDYKNWVLLLENISVLTKPGFVELVISAKFSDPNGKRSFGFDINGVLAIDKVERNQKKNKTVITFVGRPTDIQASVVDSWFAASIPESLGEFVADVVSLSIKEKLTASFEIDDAYSEKHKLNKTERQYIDAENHSDWWVDINAQMPEVEITKYLNFSAPAFTSNGVWLAFDLGNNSGVNYKEPTIPNLDADDLEDEVDRLSEELALREKSIKMNHKNSLFWLSKNIFVQINQLVSDNLTSISFKSEKVNGYIAKTDWHDDILGKGGTFAEFHGNKAISGNVKFNKTSVRWDAASGVILSGNVEVDGTANVHVHFDPLVGGGLGTTVGMKINASTGYDAAVNFGIEDVLGIPMLLAKPTINCEAMDLSAKTDGKLKFPGGWASMPALGAKMKMLLGSDYIAPSSVIGGVPTYKKNGDPEKNEDPAKKQKYKVIFPAKYTITTIEPKSVSMMAQGLKVQLNIKQTLTSNEKEIQKIKSLNKNQAQALENYYLSAKAKSCPKADGIALTLGDLEIGPNNEFIKLFKEVKKVLDNAIKDLTEGPGENNDILKGLKSAKKALDDAARAAQKALDDAARAAQKALDDAARAAQKALDDAARAAQKALDDVARAAQKVKDDAEKAAQNVVKDVTEGPGPNNDLTGENGAVRKFIGL
jgi:hypothetical protein